MQGMQANNTKGVIAGAAQNVTRPQQRALRPIDRLKGMLDAESVQKQFNDVLGENKGPFIGSIIDLYNSDTYLQKCDPKQVIMEALKAATLKLPISKQLGFAYIVPYRDTPQFQLGYKGMIQLAQRTGAYKYINAGVVYEGEFKRRDKLTGAIDLSGEALSNEIVGYFAYIETLNGFSKGIYWTKEEVKRHAQRYSKSYKSGTSAWATNFDEMAQKTVLRALLSKYGIMSIEFQTALTLDSMVEAADEQIVGAPDLDLMPSANVEEAESGEEPIEATEPVDDTRE